MSYSQPFHRNHFYPLPLFSPGPCKMPGQLSCSEPPSTPWSPGPLQPFRFRARREGMDWRRFSALDVERVAREMDVGTLQEYIGTVTFCDLEAERCPHCRNPVDPVLLKVLRMSQLSTEYLLHCQDFLSAQVAGLEDRLQGELSGREREGKELARLEAELQAARQEGRRRKKMIATQQLLLQAGANNYHKCQFCDKSFVNYSFLQGHLQRRHPEITDAERQKKRQVEQMEDGIEELRARLKLTQAKLEAEREAEALRRQQELEEQRQREAKEKQQLESWKEEERKKFYQEMGDLRQLFLQELKDIASKSSSIEARLQDLQRSGVVVSNLGTLRDTEEEEKREARERELREKVARQKSEWKKKMKEMQNIHLLEKGELRSEIERLKMSLSVDRNTALQSLQQKISSLSSSIRQREKVIRSQEETIKTLSARPVTVSAPAPVIQEEESTEEEDEEEEEPEDMGNLRQKLLESLRKNPDLVREFRPILEETLEEKLESMGLRKGTKGISKQTFKTLSSTVASQRQQKAKKLQEMPSLREKLTREVTKRVRRLQESQGTTVPTPAASWKVQGSPTQQKRSKARNPPRPVQPLAPQPAPRTIVTPRTPRTRAQRTSTPPFSSEEESGGDSAYITSPGSKALPAVRVVQAGPRQNQTVATEEDWSDTELSEGPVSPGSTRLPASQGSVVQSLTKSLEKQLSSPARRPVGGIKVLPPSASASPKSSTVMKNLQLSDEESDLELSSVEEITPQSSAPRVAGVRGSADSVGSPGTSVWSSSASRGAVW
ncbi:cilium assembly protein DZIP1L isoform X2 [Lepisosteus oculatus]|uniref:cilium assembly protein DZIP1L isoform X2 n=1 Tax=Lepisosteus oculatus TaxID=7918 RepID=UPI0035F500C2